LIAAISPAKDV